MAGPRPATDFDLNPISWWGMAILDGSHTHDGNVFRGMGGFAFEVVG